MAMMGGFWKGKKKENNTMLHNWRISSLQSTQKKANCKGWSAIFMWIVLAHWGRSLHFLYSWVGLFSASNHSDINYTFHRIRVAQPCPKAIKSVLWLINWQKTHCLISFWRLTKLTSKGWEFVSLLPKKEEVKLLNFLGMLHRTYKNICLQSNFEVVLV